MNLKSVVRQWPAIFSRSTTRRACAAHQPRVVMLTGICTSPFAHSLLRDTNGKEASTLAAWVDKSRSLYERFFNARSIAMGSRRA